MRCVVSFVSNVPFGEQSSRLRLMQGSTVYVRGFTAFRFVYGNETSQQEAESAANTLFNDMYAPSTLQNMFQPAFPTSVVAPDAVNRGEVPVPENTLPTNPPSPSPSPILPISPSPSPSSPAGLSPELNVLPPTGAPVFPSPVPVPVPIPGGGGGGVPPGVPTIGVFTANEATIDNANAAWTAPAPNGGAAISSYDLLCSTGNTGPAVSALGVSASVCSGSACSTLMLGLASGVTYTCQVRARNSAGSSAYSSASNSFTVPTTRKTYIANFMGAGEFASRTYYFIV